MEKVLSIGRFIRDGQQRLEPNGLDSTGSPWRKYANEIIRERRDITLLPGVEERLASVMTDRITGQF